MGRTPEDQTLVLVTVIRALQVFVRVAQDPQCSQALGPSGEILADWKKTMAQMQRQAERGITKLQQSEPQTKETRRQVALLQNLLDEVKLLGLDSPMEIQ